MAAVSHVLTRAEPCPATGGPCEIAQALIETLQAAMSGAGAALGPDFGVSGVIETRVCGRLCRLHWQGSDRAIAVEGALPGAGPRLRAERLRG
ncbi:hypothetical protein [Rhodobacter calidifons]|uniref:Uncharacterized protein n=1 Tax=Rhodobacter calidifons TaxID=2715277 RepID=A0ABX0GB92_9RHOB|nr:hypothetical protein [Rhodobacter calidifons]NHB78564.1 hypothetical protein [Rhodobacter calidifons]